MKHLPIETLNNLLLATSVMLLSLSHLATASETNITGSVQITSKMVKREATQQLIAPLAKPTSLSVETAGQKVTVPVDLIATHCDFEQWRDGKKVRTVPLIEFRIQSKGQIPFTWSCFESAAIHPHDFRLFAKPTGSAYASHTSLSGVKLYRVEKNNDSEAAARAFLEQGVDLSALPPLRPKVFRDAVGKEHFYTENALFDAVTVDNVTEVDGNVRVILHGNKPTPQFTFELKAGEWKRIGD